MKRLFITAPLVLLTSVITTPGHAQNPSPTDIRACTGIESDAQRLACYDRSTGRVNLPAAQKRVDQPSTSAPTSIFGHEKATAAVPSDATAGKPLSLLDSRWELSPESKLGTFNIRGYKPVYVMPAFATSNQNDEPHSPNPVNTVTTPQQLDNVEAKFQLSLKTKVWQGVFGDAGDVWVGYTQDSHWQIYNTEASRPFRETDYEPEAILMFNTNYQVFG